MYSIYYIKVVKIRMLQFKSRRPASTYPILSSGPRELSLRVSGFELVKRAA
ncbi:hypothetical protein HanIR_Chr14g0674101 [Helianthus annuus]|nr:hypothetical protein HanIR_Chr14g0674101 [Helianthus annuus]